MTTYGKLKLTAFQCEMLYDRPGDCVTESLHGAAPELSLDEADAIDETIQRMLCRGFDERYRIIFKPTVIDCGLLTEHQRFCLYDRFMGSTFCASLAPGSLCGDQEPEDALAYARAKRSMDKMATRFREAGFTIDSNLIPFW